ncbi:hypothetical protein [Carboxylicivirga sp. N1Y90]|uniref:hypothetical protein n=1 Tax=Carboxylicivirga fragile TaxID=3417571 RepID=UPI003D33D8A2|nr:hypothetical protein [Marinilabiliaceae bacterium N1Y90]
MRKLLFIAALVIGMSACEEKEINLYPSIEESAKVDITTGDFEESAIIYSSAISNAVDEAVDGDGDIERVVIEGIWFELTPKSKNTAQSMTVNLSIKKWGTEEYEAILDDFTFDIKEGKVNFIKELKAAGILVLKEQINALALGTASNDIKFEIEGDVTPEGSEVNVELEVFVSGTVVYGTTI